MKRMPSRAGARRRKFREHRLRQSLAAIFGIYADRTAHIGIGCAGIRGEHCPDDGNIGVPCPGAGHQEPRYAVATACNDQMASRASSRRFWSAEGWRTVCRRARAGLPPGVPRCRPGRPRMQGRYPLRLLSRLISLAPGASAETVISPRKSRAAPGELPRESNAVTPPRSCSTGFGRAS